MEISSFIRNRSANTDKVRGEQFESAPYYN